MSEAYLATLARMEQDISMVDRDAALASIAISLKRIADAMENPESLRLALYNGICEGIYAARPK